MAPRSWYIFFFVAHTAIIARSSSSPKLHSLHKDVEKPGCDRPKGTWTQESIIRPEDFPIRLQGFPLKNDGGAGGVGSKRLGLIFTGAISSTGSDSNKFPPRTSSRKGGSPFCPIADPKDHWSRNINRPPHKHSAPCNHSNLAVLSFVFVGVIHAHISCRFLSKSKPLPGSLALVVDVPTRTLSHLPTLYP